MVKKYQTHEYIEDMLKFCHEITENTKELDSKSFLHDSHRIIYKATLLDIQRLGWSAYNLPAGIFDIYSEINWRQLIATSYVLEQSTLKWSIHSSVIWSIVEETIPKLLPILKAMKKGMNQTHLGSCCDPNP